MIWPFTSPTAKPSHRPFRIFGPPEWQWARTGDVGWWVRADWQNTLLDESGLRLDEWRDQDRVSVVKQGPHRIVYRADLPEGSVYVKHYLVPDFRSTLRQWFRRGKGRNEGKRTRHLESIGVPTITPIALGEQRKHKFLFENYLVTPAISDAIPLNAFVEETMPAWPAGRRAEVRKRLALALAVMTARLHDAGHVHTDFHPGNILVRMGTDDVPVLAMIDLDALRVCRRLGWDAAQQNLALLNHYFWLRSERTDRLRFLACYLEARQTSPPDPKAFARGIEVSTRSWAEKLWTRWGRRCHRTNKYFKKISGPHAWGVASRDLKRQEAKALLDDPDEPFRREGARLVKDARTSAIVEVTMTVNGEPTQVFYKRFNRKKWLDPLFTYFRPSRGWQSWQAAQHMVSRALPTPQNLAFIARTRPFLKDPLFWYLPHETYIITRKADPAITLSDYARKILPGLSPEAQRVQIRRITQALAHLLRTLHERSLSDRDLKTANILILGDPNAAPIELSLIDLVGVRLIHPLPTHRRIQNLARLQTSLKDTTGRTRTDSLRFLKAYLPWGLSPREDWKTLWRTIDAAVQQKVERNQVRGRKVS